MHGTVTTQAAYVIRLPSSKTPPCSCLFYGANFRTFLTLLLFFLTLSNVDLITYPFPLTIKYVYPLYPLDPVLSEFITKVKKKLQEMSVTWLMTTLIGISPQRGISSSKIFFQICKQTI
jgi:hypothetical protein